MRLRALRSFPLPVLFAIALAPPLALAQSPSDAELQAVNSRVIELYQTGKYAEAIPLARRYASGIKARSGDNAPDYATALNNLALLLQRTNRFSEAEPLMRRALAIDEKSLGPEHKNVATDLNNLAMLLKETNRLDEAEPLFRRELAIFEKALGPDHPNYAIALNNLALALQETNRFSEAEQLFRRALAISEKNLGVDHPNVATTLSNLASVLADTNRLAEAEPLLRRALAISEKALAPDHADMAVVLNNLASLLQRMNQLTESEALQRRALAILEKALGPDHPNVATALHNVAGLMQDADRFAEAEPLYRRALAIDVKALGADHPHVARHLNKLAEVLRATNWPAEAEPLFRRALVIYEKTFGPDHPDVAETLTDLAELLRNMNRLEEAESLYNRGLVILEKSLGPDHTSVAATLSSLASLLLVRNRLAEAEPVLRRAISIYEKSLGPDHPRVAAGLNGLGLLLQQQNRLAEAEPLFRRALDIDEKSLGPEHTNVATDLNNLAMALQVTNCLAEAEALYRRSLAINEKTFGPDHPDVANSLGNLALLLRETNRFAEAVPLYFRALAIDQKSLGSDNQTVARDLNNLAELLRDLRLFAKAEPLYREALSIDEKSLGPDHPAVARDLNNLALLLRATNRSVEAERLLQRSLDIINRSLGADGPNGTIIFENLAELRAERGDWEGALVLLEQAKKAMTGARHAGVIKQREFAKAVLAQNTGNLRNFARTLYRADRANPLYLLEAFELAQWALQNEAADALSAMSARFSVGSGELAKLVRADQDLRRDRFSAVRRLDAVEGKPHTTDLKTARMVVAEIDLRLDVMEAALRQKFPDYAKLATPEPLPVAEAQALLGEGQALVLFLDVPQFGNVPGETLVFAMTDKSVRWLSLPLGTPELERRVMRLRCGLDTTNWREGNKNRETCMALLDVEVTDEQLPPFDAAAAHELYRDLFGSIEDLIQGKRLLIVPSSALTQLPFEVLVAAKPDDKLPRFEAYKTAVWLGQQQAITILPSVGSLKALRAAKASEAPEPFAGFGNPLLTGVDSTDKSAWAKQECGKPAPPKQSRIASLVASIASLFRGGAVNVEDLRRQPPLPETADELCAVGRGLGVPEAGLSKAVHLGKEATVSKVKALSRSGDLARARVVHFATHGLLAGETAMFAKNKAEPTLLLTPPAEASEEDNGLLTASEVAQLNLNADWVVMSACNTAGGSAEGAEALSGLARAFFYAGARALLVSHWPVELRGRRRHHNRLRKCDEGESENRPRGGAAQRGGGADRARRALRSSQRLGALRAGGQWRTVERERFNSRLSQKSV